MILVDGHVHIYDCYNLKKFLDSALRNFEIMAKQLADEGSLSAVLLLAESKQSDWFSGLQACARNGDSAIKKQLSSWEIDKMKNETAIRAVNDDGNGFFIVAGRQIVTEENLEVLALVTAAHFPDGNSMESTVKSVSLADAIPVIPWSAGKWLGERGNFLKNFLKHVDDHYFFLGDTGTRPSFWPAPSQFQLAAQKGIRVIAGTDPLPLPSEARRPGSYGFMIAEQLDESCPSNNLKKLLKDNETKIVNYGKLENPVHFLRNQFSLRLNKFRKK